MRRTVKIAAEIDAKLYQELVSVAKESGRSQRLLGPEVMAAPTKSIVSCTHVSPLES